MSRVLDRVMFVLALVVALGATGIVLGLLWLRSPWGNAFVRDQIEARLADAVVGEVRLGRVEGDPLSGIELHDFALIGADGVPLIAAERVLAQYGLRPFFDQKIVIDRVRLVRPEIHLVRGPDGRWNFQTLFKPRPPRPPDATPGWGSWIDIQELVFIDGTVDVRLAEGGGPVLDWNENRFVDLNGTLALGIFARDENVKRFVSRDLSFDVTAPPLSVRRLTGTGIVTPDSVLLQEIAFMTPGSRIRADGLWALAERDSLALDVAAPRLAMEEVRRFFPSVRLDGVAAFEGRVVGPAGALAVTIDRARVETGRSTVEVTGRIADLDSPRLDLDATAAPLAPADVRRFVEAYPVAQPVSGPIRVEGPLHRLDVVADLTAPAGRFTAAGTIDRRGAVTGYDLTATSQGLDVGALIGRPEVDLTLTGRYRLAGRGFGARDLDARITAELGRSRIYRWEVAALETRGRLLGREYVADTVWARMPATVLRGAGRFDLAGEGSMDADVSVESENPGELWSAFGDWGERVRGEFRLDGPYRGFDVQGTLVAGSVDVQGVTADSFAGEIRLTDVAGGDFRADVDGVFHRMSLAGLFADTAAVQLDYGAGIMTVEGEFDLAGEGSAELLAVGDFTGPTATIALERLRYQTPEQTWRLEEGGRLAYTDGQLVAESARITQDGQVLRLDGVLGMEPGAPSDLEFAAEDVALKDVARLAGQPPGDWEGRATVRGRLTGTRRAPVIDVTGEVSEGMIRGFRFHRMIGSLEYDDQVAAVDLRVVTPAEGHALVLSGRVPIDMSLVGGVDRLPERPIDLVIRGENTDLSLIGAVVPGLEDLSGPVDLLVEITGTSQSPRFEGSATMRDGRMRIPATGMTYQDIVGTIRFNNDRILVEEIRGTDGDDGTFRIAGEIAMQNLRLGEFDLEATGTELEVLDLARQDIQVNARITVGGTTDTPILTGWVEVDEAIYRLPERAGKDVIDLEEAMIYVDIPGTRRREVAALRSPSLWTRARIEIDVIVTDDAILQSNKARIEIAGDLSLVKPSGERVPTFSGTLEVRRGFYEEFGRRFTIEGGNVFFYGTPELNPGLHIVATRTVENVEGVGDVQVRITLGGTLNNPTIDISSTPAFDRSEVISIALFGTPRPAAGQERQFEETVRGLATDVGLSAAAPLQAALSEELGVDVFDISQRRDPGGDTATLFRIGKFISPDVFVTFEQEVGADEASRVALRYQMTEHLTLQVNAGTASGRREREGGGGVAGVDLFWEFTY